MRALWLKYTKLMNPCKLPIQTCGGKSCLDSSCKENKVQIQIDYIKQDDKLGINRPGVAKAVLQTHS